MWYNIYYITMKQSEMYSGHGGGTRQLHQEYLMHVKLRKSSGIPDGAEIGSTGIE